MPPERLTVVDEPEYEELLQLLDNRPPWHADALCKEAPPTVSWFPTKGDTGAAAKAICRRCLAVDDCLAYALADPDIDGTWGGTTLKERRAIRAGKAA